MTDKPPEGAVASADDFQVQRDEDGELLPTWEPIPGNTNMCPVCDGSGTTVVHEEDEEEPEFEDCENCTGSGAVPAMVKVVPLNQGRAQKHLPDSGMTNDLTDRQTVTLLNEHFVEPDFELDESNPKDAVNSFSAFGVEPLIMALYNASGFEMSKGVVLDNADVVEAVEGNSKTGS